MQCFFHEKEEHTVSTLFRLYFEHLIPNKNFSRTSETAEEKKGEDAELELVLKKRMENVILLVFQ